MRHILSQIVISALGSALFALVSAAAVLAYTSQSLSPTAPVPVYAFVVSHAVMAMAIIVAWRFRRHSTAFGRSITMQENVRLLKLRTSLKPEKSVIRSTRFTRWPLSEESPIRVAYRNELDQAVLVEKREVRRIWTINNKEDAERLKVIVERYKNNANISIRLFFDVEPYMIPELQVINSQTASISFPQSRNPQSIDAGTVVTDPDSVQVIQNYFDVLWDNAKAVLDGGRVNDVTMRSVDARAK
jgi:hypothetical protein